MPGERLNVAAAEGVHDGAVGHIAIYLLHGDGRGGALVVVTDAGVVELAVRIPRDSHCYFSDAAVAGRRAAVIVGFPREDEDVDYYVLRCSSQVAASCRMVSVFPASRLNHNSAQDIFAAESHLAVHSAPAQTVWRLEWSDSEPMLLGGWQLDGVLGEPTATMADATFYTQYSATAQHSIRVSVGAAPGDPPSRELIAERGVDALGLSTDGRDMVWHQGYARPAGSYNEFERVELWASPFATTPDELVPRRLTTLVNGYMGFHFHVGFGRWADSQGADGREIWIVDLRDGSHQTLRAPSGELWIGGVVYLGPEEIAAAPGTRGAFSEQRTVMLMRYDSLEPPVPAPP